VILVFQCCKPGIFLMALQLFIEYFVFPSEDLVFFKFDYRLPLLCSKRQQTLNFKSEPLYLKIEAELDK